MKAKMWLTVFGVVSFLLIGAVGFFCFSSSEKYSKARGSWDAKVGVIRNLEKKEPYPNEKNVKELEALVGGYDGSVKRLFESLSQFQKELNTTLVNTRFQEKFKNKVQEFRQLAKAQRFELNLERDFQLGFDAYATSLPSPKIVPVLNYEMEAIDHLLKTLVKSGAESLTRFDRDLIPGEVGGPNKQEISVVHKYPIRMEFKSNHKSFQEFLNTITNDREYFYIVSVLKIRNENQEGPEKGSNADTIPSFENPDTFRVADLNDLRRWGYGTASTEEVAQAARADGFNPSGIDARVLMGQEKLDVFMKVEVVRFIDPEKEKQANN